MTDEILKRKLNEKMLLISIVGTLEAIAVGSMSIDESERFLFSPGMVKWLKAQQCRDVILDILEKGCELEDVASLVPQELIKNINELKKEALEVMKEYQEFDKRSWIQQVNFD